MTIPSCDLVVAPPQAVGPDIVLQAELRGAANQRHSLWFRVPARCQENLTTQSDPFLLGFLFLIMRLGKPVNVRGRVSPSLLRNLDEYMRIWSAWRPKSYAWVEITGEEEAEEEQSSVGNTAVMAFSGGVDSCFTAWRHRNHLAGRRNRDIEAGVFVHGFDIPLDEPDSYIIATEKNLRLLSSIGMELIPLATNTRSLPTRWDDSHAAAIASCLSLLQERYSSSLIAATVPFSLPGFIWGSTPWIDRLLSSARFEIVSDGAECPRLQKVSRIAAWEEARRNLRVCWQGPAKHENCCRCEKCIRTILEFRVSGSAQPPCFTVPLTEARIRSLRLTRNALIVQQMLSDSARSQGLGNESWARALRTCLRRNHIRNSLAPLLFGRRVRKAAHRILRGLCRRAAFIQRPIRAR